jgi:hypothetical protein
MIRLTVRIILFCKVSLPQDLWPGLNNILSSIETDTSSRCLSYNEPKVMAGGGGYGGGH